MSVHETGLSASTHMAGTVAAATSVATEVLSPMKMAQLVLVSGGLGPAERLIPNFGAPSLMLTNMGLGACDSIAGNENFTWESGFCTTLGHGEEKAD